MPSRLGPSEPNSSATPTPTPIPILYRPNVAAILLDREGRIFIGERISVTGAWQFPQGGVDDTETLEGALFREVQEEIGVAPDLITIKETRGGYRYEFPKGRLKYGIYAGQEQTYYLCDFHGADADVKLDAHDPEFSRHKWIKPADFRLSWVPKFKRPTYVAVFKDFFGVDLG
jgi:putative (di)nucleoside polyphosphate hydrolase